MYSILKTPTKWITVHTEFYKGGTPMPAPPDPMKEAKARDYEAQQQEMRDQARAERERVAAEAQRAKDIEASTGRVARGYEGALSYGSGRLGAKGLDANSGVGESIMSMYRAALDRARSTAPDIVNDAGSLFSPSLYDDTYNTVRGSERQKLSKQLNGFMGDGFEYSDFADTADDAILQSILGDQKTEAMRALDAAKARGTINDVGYQSGLKELGNQYDAGYSKAQGLGGGVLSRYRKDLSDFANQTRGRISEYDLGDDFNMGSVQGRYGTMKGDRQNSLRGDILAAIGGTNFFDTGTLLGKAGNASGIGNNNPLSSGSTTAGTQAGFLSSPLNTQKSSNTTEDKTNYGF